MLFIVADQIAQRETIVRGDEVDARVRAAPIVLIQIGAPGEPVSQLPNAAFIAFPETADGIAVFAVPFSPKYRKIPNLIAAFADVPRFRD